MGIAGTTKSAVAAGIGITAGVFIVPYEDWSTKLVGAVVGGVLFVMVFLCLSLVARCRYRADGPPRSKRRVGQWDDFDDEAYRVERVFMDDGKPW